MYVFSVGWISSSTFLAIDPLLIVCAVFTPPGERLIDEGSATSEQSQIANPKSRIR